MSAVAHGECQVCGSKAPVELATRVIELETALRSIVEMDALQFIDREGAAAQSNAMLRAMRKIAHDALQ